MAGLVDKKLSDLGIVLPTPAAPIANYVGSVRSGSLLFVSDTTGFVARSEGMPTPDNEVAAWRHAEHQLTPLRPRIRQVARALLIQPRPLPYPVVKALADEA